MEQHDILIIGAGMAGLIAAQQLQNTERPVTILERWPQIGGRMSTYPIGSEIADDGAQFFTVRHPKFQTIVEGWLNAGLVKEWGRGWSDGSLSTSYEDGYPRYIVPNGMRALPKHMARHLDVRKDEMVIAVTPTADGWMVKTAVNTIHHARTLLMTPPVPQSLAILNAGKTILPSPAYAALNHIQYAPSLTGLFWINGEVNFPAPGAVQRPAQSVVWMADNQRKGVSQTRLITVQASPGLSVQLFEANDTEALSDLMDALRPFLSKTAVIHQSHLKRWRYALPTILHPERHLLTTATTGETAVSIIFAGDAFKEPRVEGAVLSGLSAATALASS